MKQIINFVCSGDSFDEIPEEVLLAARTTLPYVHVDSKEMAKVAREIKNYNKDVICRVPFCSTVEAEAFGGDIKLGDHKAGPRVNKYVIDKMDKFQQIEKIDLTKGRAKEVLEALEILQKEQEVSVLNVIGPFTIISALIEPTVFYKALRKHKDIVEHLIHIIEEGMVEYIKAGIEKGVKIISYADPAGSLDIVGPKVYKEFVGKTNINILKRIEAYLQDTIVHLCGKLSSGLESIGLVEKQPLNFSVGLKYGEALLKVNSDNKEVKFIGNACLKKSSLILKEPILWSIRFLEGEVSQLF